MNNIKEHPIDLEPDLTIAKKLFQFEKIDQLLEYTINNPTLENYLTALVLTKDIKNYLYNRSTVYALAIKTYNENIFINLE